jgi:threonine dehydrogenase-like Zn-dependent dehydrogenase
MVTGPGEGRVRDVQKPVPGPGQALVRMEYAGICGGDPGLFKMNMYGASPENPRIYGHEFYGEVVEINNPQNIPTRVKAGDKVVGPQNAPCGVCDQCMEGRFSVCSATYGAKCRPGGCFGEYFERDLDKLFVIPKEIDPLVAVLAEPLAIAVFDIRNSGVGLGSNVLIIGAGAVGLMIGMLARLNGSRHVVFAELSEKRIEFVKSLGFTSWNSAKDDVVKLSRELTGGADMDYVFEVSASQPGWNISLDTVRQGGMVVPVGLPHNERTIDFGKVYRKQIDLNTVNMHHLNDFSEAVNLIVRGNINADLRRLVTSVWPLEETLEAIEASVDKSGNDIKIVLRPGIEKRYRLV